MKIQKYFFLSVGVLILLVGFGCDTTSDGDESETEAPELSLVEHPIDTNFDGIHCIRVIDLDGDGDLDIVGGSEITPYSQSMGIAWWKNNGDNPVTWTRYTVDSNFDHVMSVDVNDINGDSHPDIVATSWNQHQIAWWQNSSNPESNWMRHLVKANYVNAHDAKCFDINGDGNRDIAGASSGGEVIVGYHNGSPIPGWNVQVLNNTFYGGKTVLVHDMDRDGDLDIMGTASDANRITWWENQGGNPISWISRAVDHGFIGGSGIHIIDVNLDGLYDVIATSWKNDQLAYWICRNLSNDQWEKTVVTDQLDIAVNAYGSDIDRDGDIDIVAIGKDPGELSIFFNDNFSWTRQIIKSNFEGGSALSIIDLDNDGDFDIVAGASALGNLSWWENLSN